MKSRISAKSDGSAQTQPRTLYHVYQKLNRLRDLIAEGNYPNAAALAEKMEVSIRTVNRYLDNLRECRSPLANDRRRGGYYFSDPYGSCRR